MKSSICYSTVEKFRSCRRILTVIIPLFMLFSVVRSYQFYPKVKLDPSSENINYNLERTTYTTSSSTSVGRTTLKPNKKSFLGIIANNNILTQNSGDIEITDDSNMVDNIKIKDISTSDQNMLQDKYSKIVNSTSFWRLMVVLLCMLWSTNFAVIKTILNVPGMDASLYLATRFGIASLLLLPKTIQSFNNKDLMIKGMSIGFCIFLAYVGQAIGLETSTANKSAFICSMNVVW